MGFRLINPLKHGPNQIRCFSKRSSQLQSHGPTLSLCINVWNQYHLSHQWMSLLDADGSCLSCVLQMWWSSRRFCAPAVGEWSTNPSHPAPQQLATLGRIFRPWKWRKKKNDKLKQSSTGKTSWSLLPFYFNLIFFWGLSYVKVPLYKKR